MEFTEDNSALGSSTRSPGKQFIFSTSPKSPARPQSHPQTSRASRTWCWRFSENVVVQEHRVRHLEPMRLSERLQVLEQGSASLGRQFVAVVMPLVRATRLGGVKHISDQGRIFQPTRSRS